jgi:hypothetical protein
MKYSELLKAQSDAISAFPCAFAFTDKQLKRAMKELWVSNISELCTGYSGVIYKKTDALALKALTEKLDHAKKEFLKNPDNLKSALIYELANHEYGYTFDISDTLIALDLYDKPLTEEQETILAEAIKEYLSKLD